MTVEVRSFDFTEPFRRELLGSPADVRNAAKAALQLLLSNPRAKTLRLHALKGYGKPTIYKIDVYANSSWQITFELDGTRAILRRLAPHKQIDRRPR